MILLITIGFICLVTVISILFYKHLHKDFEMSNYQKAILTVLTILFLVVIYSAIMATVD